jgi:hypothetical protein
MPANSAGGQGDVLLAGRRRGGIVEESGEEGSIIGSRESLQMTKSLFVRAEWYEDVRVVKRCGGSPYKVVP